MQNKSAMEHFIEENDPYIIRCAICGRVISDSGYDGRLYCFKDYWLFPTIVIWNFVTIIIHKIRVAS